MRYINNRENLKIMMCAMTDKQKSIQYEAFYVFNLFVMNPKQSYPVRLVLWNNKAKLIKLMTIFHREREETRFLDEKAKVIKALEALSHPINLAKASEAAKSSQPETHRKVVTVD